MHWRSFMAGLFAAVAVKANGPTGVRENAATLDFTLTPAAINALGARFEM